MKPTDRQIFVIGCPISQFPLSLLGTPTPELRGVRWKRTCRVRIKYFFYQIYRKILNTLTAWPWTIVEGAHAANDVDGVGARGCLGARRRKTFLGKPMHVAVPEWRQVKVSEKNSVSNQCQVDNNGYNISTLLYLRGNSNVVSTVRCSSITSKNGWSMQTEHQKKLNLEDSTLPNGIFIECTLLLRRRWPLTPHLPHLNRLLPWTDREQALPIWTQAAMSHGLRMRIRQRHQAFAGRVLMNGDAVDHWGI